MVEQTTNLGGGRVWPLGPDRGGARRWRSEFGLRTHLDGARLLNATVASGESAATYAAGFETAWIDFSKGLGAPIGACLAGSDELIAEAWRYKQMLGGSMRQAGIRRRRCPLRPPAQRRAPRRRPRQRQVPRRGPGRDRRRRDRPGSTVETNIVIFDVADADGLHDKLKAAGVETSLLEGRVRMVTHLDVDRAGIETALAEVQTALA